MCVRRITSDGGTIAIVERSRLLAPFGLAHGLRRSPTRISPMGSGEFALLCATTQPRHPVRKQDETRQGYDRAANAEQE